MKKLLGSLYYVFLGVLVVAGIALTLYFGLQPQSTPKIKPSQVTNPERLGEAIAQRLWEEIKDNQVVFLGVDPDHADDLRVWKGFLDALPADIKIKHVVIDPNIANKSLIDFDSEVDIKNEMERFKAGLEKAREEKIKLAVIVPSFYSAQTILDNPVQRLKDETGIQPISLSIAQPTLNRAEEATAAFPCATGSGDTAGLGSWGCLIQQKSRGLYRGTWTTGKYLVLMDQIGIKDYLVLMRLVPK